MFHTSVPDPPDPHVFRPPGSGSIRSEVWIRKTLDSYCFVTSFGLFIIEK
jgi:hypothetical protein